MNIVPVDGGVIPPLNPPLPSQVTPPQGPSLPLPSQGQDPNALGRNTLIGRLVLPPIDPNASEGFLKAMRILAALNPVKLPPKDMSSPQPGQKAIVVQQDSPQAVQKPKTEDLTSIQVFKAENESLASNEQQNSSFQQNLPKETETHLVKNNEAEVLAKQVESPGQQEGEAKGIKQESQTTPSANSSQTSKSSIEKPQTNPTDVKTPQSTSEASVKPASEQSKVDLSTIKPQTEDRANLVATQDSSNQLVKPASDKSHVNLPAAEGKVVEEKEIERSTKDARGHLGVATEAVVQAPPPPIAPPVLDNEMAIIAWLGILPLPQQMEEQRLRRNGKNVKPRQSGQMISYRLSDLLFTLLAAFLGGSRTLIEIIQFVEQREKWFKVVLGDTFELPPREIYWRLLTSIDSDSFSKVIKLWLMEVSGHGSLLKSTNGKPLLPAIALWLTPIGIIFGQDKGSDSAIGNQAMVQLLQAFTFNEAVIMTKIASEGIDLPRAIEKSRAQYIVELDSEKPIAGRIESLIEAALDARDPNFRQVDSYLEGIDHLQLKSLKVDAEFPSTEITMAKTLQILKLQGEIITRGIGLPVERFYVSNFPHVFEEFFYLYRLQQPLDAKISWLLNCELPIRAFKQDLQQCHESISLFKRYAKSLLLDSGGPSSMDEKMKLAASDFNVLLGYVNRKLS